LYIRLVLKNENIFDVFNQSIRKNYINVRDEEKYSSHEEGKEKLVKSFLRVCLKYRFRDLIKIINNFDEYEFISLLDVFRKIEYIPIFFQNSDLQEIIKNKISELKSILNKRSSHILLFKKLLSIKLKKTDLTFAEEELNRLKDTRAYDYDIFDTPVNYAAMSFVLDRNTFEYFLRKQEGHPFRYYFELGLYSALYRSYIELLKNNKNVENIIGDYIRYLNYYTEGTYNSRFLNKNISCLISFIFSNSKLDSAVLFNLKRLLLISNSNFSPFHFCMQLFFNDADLFSNLINDNDLRVYVDELNKWKDNYQSYVDRCFQLASFYSNLNASKSIDFIIKGINDGILRHGWRKDSIVSYDLINALGLLWKNSWEAKDKLIKYSKDVFKLTLKVTEITDGSETWRGPYNLIELIMKYDLDFAYRLEKKLIKYLDWQKYSISLITSFLMEKIKLGVPLNEIEEEMTNYRKDYNFKGKPKADYYEEKFKVYLEVVNSNLYPADVKQIAFEKAYEQVEIVLQQKIDYFLSDYEKYRKIFTDLCIQYKKTDIIPIHQKNDTYSFDSEKKIQETNLEFIPKITDASSKKDIEIIYKELSDYNYHRILTNNNHWKILITKTYEICENITLFIELLKKDSFPHYDNMTSNSQYYHYGLAASLKNVNTRKETITYLSEYSGHGGFINIMKAYEVNKDIEMCRKLFERFLKFCHLLVD